jgi:hypothetical protein
MSRAKEHALRRLLPNVDDPALERLLNDPGLILYTEEEMPKTYQHWDGQLQGVHLASYNISANGSEQFPWSSPAGTHRSRNVSSFRFLWLPRDARGQRRPIVWFTKYVAGDSQSSYAWSFPAGAVVGEVLMMRAADGYDYTFELRVRMRHKDAWNVDVFRPFPTAERLAERIRELRPKAERNAKLAAFLHHLEAPRDLPWQYLTSNHPNLRPFVQWMGVDMLPAVDDDQLVAELLGKTTFTSCLDQAWRIGTRGNWTFAPTTEAAFHVVPANYDAGFVEVNRKSCLRCHETANQPVDRFQFGRDWYGHIRGSDGIFSFHPFEPGTVSGNGFGGQVSMRQAFIEAGVIERYDGGKHPRSVYTSLPELEG